LNELETHFDRGNCAVRRSIEDGLQRLGVSNLDILFVHDISSDSKLLPTPSTRHAILFLTSERIMQDDEGI
jgi:aryl-alcohol dehydrogenase-like predicted oxidoreductase